MRPLEQQTILVTGSTSGLGRRVARELAERGAAVLVHGRSRERLEQTREETGAAGAYLADLRSLDRVRRLAGELRRDHERLHALVNNAGVIAGRERELSDDGLELGFAVNYLAGFLLTLELMPLLRGSAPARVVNVSSVGQSPIDFDDPMLERGYDPMRSYTQSKLAQVLFTIELAERVPPGEVTVNALHPATLMDTNMVRRALGRSTSSVEEGARATVRLIASPELDGVSGRYFDGQREARAHPQAYDAGARGRLWDLSERLAAPGALIR